MKEVFKSINGRIFLIAVGIKKLGG